MSEVVENVSEQNSAQSKEAAVQSAQDVTSNNVEAADKAVPEVVESISATDDNAVSKEAAEKSTSPKVDNKKTPVKRTPSKRTSFIERAQKESEELVKNMGGSLEIEGGRKTRSSTRGTPTRSAAASTPPPVKKARSSPASGASTPTRPRGRGRKIDVADDAAEEEETKSTPSKKKTPVKGKKAAGEDEEVEEKEVEKKSEEKEDKVDSTESNVVASSEQTKDKLVEKPESDETDATVLEPVVEETLSQVAADVLTTEKTETKEHEDTSAPVELVSEISDSYKSDSPMETEEVKHLTEKAKSIETTTKSAVEALQVAKEPTPEPMEIDSSSKSNDTFDQMDDDVVEIVQEPIKKSEVTSTKAIELNNLQKVEENVKENSVARSAAAAPPVAIFANNSAVDVVDANENTTEETTPAAHDLNKAENDLCEPKIATSPPISASTDNKSSVTTPQTCN